MNKVKLIEKIENLAAEANISLRKDVVRILKKYFSEEKNAKAKKALGWIIKNAKIAKSKGLAICQDTGLPVVFIEAGRGQRINASFIELIKKGIERGYRKNYLRASVVCPLKRNTPSYKGLIYHLDFYPAKRGIKVTIFPKGFGSENKSQLKMFNPTADFSEIEAFIVESVKKAGPEACPPFVVGVGIGGTSDEALLLAKKALIESLDRANPDALLDKIEKRLLRKINSLNIGPMGLGGEHTCLAVKIKKCFTHIAGLPVGVNISCHALRSATIQVTGRMTQVTGE